MAKQLRLRCHPPVESLGIRVHGVARETRPAAQGDGAVRWRATHLTLVVVEAPGASLIGEGLAPQRCQGSGVLLLRPERWYLYGPLAGHSWRAWQLEFDGPLPRLWIDHGLWDQAWVPLSAAGLVLRACRSAVQAASLGDWAALCPLIFTVMHARAQQQEPEPKSVLTRWAAAMQEQPQHRHPAQVWAQQAGLAVSTLRQAFRRQFGMAPHAFLLECRLQALRAALVAGGSVAQAARQAGFASADHAARLFRQSYGQSPRAWQRSI